MFGKALCVVGIVLALAYAVSLYVAALVTDAWTVLP